MKDVKMKAALAEVTRQRERADTATQAWANATAQRDALATELRLTRHALAAERNRASALEQLLNKATMATTPDHPALQEGA